jgi:hypothetical protein
MHRLLATMILLLGSMVVAGSTTAAAASAPESAPRSSAHQTTEPARLARRDALAVRPADARVVLYGDSLALEAGGHFRNALVSAGVTDVTLQVYGGTAICVLLDRMRTDAATLRPTAVVVEFSGNAITPCMMDETGRSLAEAPEAYHQKYRGDAQQVLEIFETTGTQVYFAGAPLTRRAAEDPDGDADWLNELYASLAADSTHGRYVDSGRATLRGNRWTATLPCLPNEPCTGGVDADGTPVNVVRAPDGGHFCPGAPDASSGVTEECPVWSSGAYRYGSAMAAPVMQALGVTTAET